MSNDLLKGAEHGQRCAYRDSPSAAILLTASASAPSAGRGAIIAMADPTIVLRLSIEPDTKPPRALAESGFTTFKDVADRPADRRVFQSTRHVADRR